jgi:ribosome maturation factor RimP
MDKDEGAPQVRFIRESGMAAQIAGLVEPALDGLGFRLVRVHVTGADGQTVQIMAERPDGSMTVDDCEQISYAISTLLDAYDPLPGAYRLEISSPGIDRPLVRARDFEDWAGYETKIELKQSVGGRKRWRGVIEGYADGEARVECEVPELGKQVLGFPLDLVGEARLVLTDDLIREALRRSKKAAKGEAAGDGTELDMTLDPVAPEDAPADETPRKARRHPGPKPREHSKSRKV